MIFVGCDHAAFNEKEEFVKKLKSKFELQDVGTFSSERCNYPDFAASVVKNVLKDPNANKGILICGSGIGMSMVANRYANIRAALCRTEEEAKLSRNHNDANILCMGARLISLEQMLRITEKWLNENFEEGRHSDRIKLFNQLGEKFENI